MHKPTENNFTERQRNLLIEMVRHTDIQAACKAAEIGRTTAYRWLGQPAFRAELSRLRNDTMSQALSSIKSLTNRAAQELGALLDSNNEGLRRLVCKDILRHAIQIREIEEIEQRLEQLEQKLKDKA